jgi:hypothetical protein
VTNPDMTKRQGGGVHMQAGGALKAMQAIAKAAESAGQKAPVTANKSLVGLQDFHTSLMDNVRARAKVAQDQMDSWDYKYAPGQYVFTEHGAKNNLPPLKILEKSRSGWNIVREDPNNPLSKKVIDPETGKAMRTPYEPGYRVRREISPDDWSEFVIPESAIKGSVSEAKGGAIRMQVGGLSRLAKLATAGEEVAPVVKRGFSPRLLESTTSKMMDELLAANPKLTPEEALRKASTQAEKKLTWEKEQKPALVKQYGPLARASYAKSNPQKMQNTPEAVQQRIQKANEFLDQPTEPWTPPRPELQAFDRSAIKDALEGFPGIEQTAFPRDIPTRASTSHVEELYSDPVNRELIKKQIKRGLPLGGETFYASLYPIKQAVLEAGMPAEKFDQWIYSLAPASARNSIINETAVGQFLRDMNARGIPLTEENVAREMAAYKQKFGVGLPLMPIHRQGVANVLEGGQDLREMNKANIPTNYKIPTYGTQKAGDFGKSVVLDVHEAAGQTQGSRYHPYFKEQGGFGNTEYNVGEQGMMGIADELGIPGGMAQAGRWFGGGELTGLKSPRGDALDILEKQVAYTLKQQGKQPNPANIRAEILRQIQTGEGQLLPWYKGEGIPDVRETGLQRKDGGSVNESFTQRLSSALQGFAIGGEVSDNTTPDMTDGGQINYGGQYAKGGTINMPVRSLKQVKSRRYDGGGYVDPLSAPSFSVGESDLIDRAKKLISEQIAKEGAVLSTPEGRKDIALKVASTLPGLGLGGDLVDLVDLVQSLIPGLNKPASVMDTEGKGDKVAKYPLRNLIGPPTSKDFQEAFKARGWLGESEAPVTEFAGMLVAPGALAKTPRAIEGGLNRATAAARRGSTPAMLTAEAVAPDLGQFRSPEWQNYLTKKLITEEGAPVGMTTMGGQKTQKFPGQGLYVNRAGEFEANPMVGVSIPRAGNLSKNQPLLADIATAGKELGQEAMAAHRFIPMMTNQIKDATSMMVTGAGGKPLTPEQVKALAARMPEMIVSHSPQTGGLFLAPFSPAKGIQPEFLEAQKAVQEVLGKGAKIQYGRTDPTKDLLYFGDYAEKGARAPSAESQAMRKRLKSMDVVFPRKPSGSPSTSGGLNQVPANAGG